MFLFLFLVWQLYLLELMPTLHPKDREPAPWVSPHSAGLSPGLTGMQSCIVYAPFSLAFHLSCLDVSFFSLSFSHKRKGIGMTKNSFVKKQTPRSSVSYKKLLSLQDWPQLLQEENELCDINSFFIFLKFAVHHRNDSQTERNTKPEWSVDIFSGRKVLFSQGWGKKRLLSL